MNVLFKTANFNSFNYKLKELNFELNSGEVSVIFDMSNSKLLSPFTNIFNGSWTLSKGDIFVDGSNDVVKNLEPSFASLSKPGYFARFLNFQNYLIFDLWLKDHKFIQNIYAHNKEIENKIDDLLDNTKSYGRKKFKLQISTMFDKFQEAILKYSRESYNNFTTEAVSIHQDFSNRMFPKNIDSEIKQQLVLYKISEDRLLLENNYLTFLQALHDQFYTLLKFYLRVKKLPYDVNKPNRSILIKLSAISFVSNQITKKINKLIFEQRSNIRKADKRFQAEKKKSNHQLNIIKKERQQIWGKYQKLLYGWDANVNKIRETFIQKQSHLITKTLPYKFRILKNELRSVAIVYFQSQREVNHLKKNKIPKQKWIKNYNALKSKKINYYTEARKLVVSYAKKLDALTQLKSKKRYASSETLWKMTFLKALLLNKRFLLIKDIPGKLNVEFDWLQKAAKEFDIIIAALVKKPSSWRGYTNKYIALDSGTYVQSGTYANLTVKPNNFKVINDISPIPLKLHPAYINKSNQIVIDLNLKLGKTTNFSDEEVKLAFLPDCFSLAKNKGYNKPNLTHKFLTSRPVSGVINDLDVNSVSFAVSRRITLTAQYDLLQSSVALALDQHVLVNINPKKVYVFDYDTNQFLGTL